MGVSSASSLKAALQKDERISVKTRYQMGVLMIPYTIDHYIINPIDISYHKPIYSQYSKREFEKI